MGVADCIIHTVILGIGGCDCRRGDIDGRVLSWRDDQGVGWSTVLRSEFEVGAYLFSGVDHSTRVLGNLGRIEADRSLGRED